MKPVIPSLVGGVDEKMGVLTGATLKGSPPGDVEAWVRYA
jgi:hypothetical protein